MALEVSDSSRWSFLYQMVFADGNTLEFPIYLDKASNNFIPRSETEIPGWAALDYQQCSNCPLSKTDVPTCPVAVNLVPLLELCGSLASYDRVHLNLVTAERTVTGDTSLQRVLSSILGLIIATSPCPHTEYLKPMARFHLPLASEDETVYRTTSMYLLAQYFLYKDGKEYSLELDKLKQIYNELKIINRALARRLKAASSEDAAVNAIILLDLLSQSVTWSIEEDLETLRYLFKRYGVG